MFAPEVSSVPVYSSRQTRESMAVDRFGLVAASHKVMGDDFPRQVTLPNHELQDGQTLTMDGVQIIVRELGPGEAECMTCLSLPDERAVFTGDAIQNGMTPYLLEGRSGAWLTQLMRLREELDGDVTIYPGHGEPGDLSLIDWQIGYLNKFRALVLAHGTDSDERIVEEMNASFPDFQPVAAIPDLIDKNVPALKKELMTQE